MKKQFFTPVIFLLGFFFIISGKSFGQTATDAGIRVKEDKGKTFVYEVKVTGMQSAVQAQYLDSKMKAKYGVVTSASDASTGICTVEAVKDILPTHLSQIVKSAGFEVSKTFN